MSGDHHLEARIDRMKADLRASRKHFMVDMEKLAAHGRAWWKEADKATIIAVTAGAVVAGAALVTWLAGGEE